MPGPGIGAMNGAPTTVRIHLLGTFRVEGVDNEALGSRKGRSLLKYLACRSGVATSADRLIDALWTDAQPADPPAQLAVLVSRLRGALGRDTIRFAEGAYRLHGVWVDVDALAAALTGGDLARLREAIDLSRGGLLPGEDAEWIVEERHRIDGLVAKLRSTGARLALQHHDAELAATWSADALRADPFDEEALRHLMLAEQQRGRTAAGLKAYADARRTLIDELGVGPSAETEAVHRSLLIDEAPAAHRSPLDQHDQHDQHDQPDQPPRHDQHVVPNEPHALVGRRTELRSLLDEVMRAEMGHGRFVVIEGEAGIGKSSLLRAFHEQAATRALVLRGAGEPVFGALPLQPLVDALSGHLDALGPLERAELLAGHLATIGRLLGTSVPDADHWLDASMLNRQLIASLEDVFRRLATRQAIVLTIDDIHLSDATTIEVLTWLHRRIVRLVVIGTRRPGTRDIAASDRVLQLGPLDRHETEELVGADLGARLFERTRGNPLFLTQLAMADAAEMPASLIDAVNAIVEQLGPDGELIRAAANLGETVDAELVASITGANVLSLLSTLDLAVARAVLVLDAGQYRFRHALVREALASRTPLPRAAYLHREAARVLEQRVGHDPLEIAHHARLAGDLVHAADALCRAAESSTMRFDRGAAEAFLDQAIAMHPAAARYEARSRVRTMRGRYDDALADVERALSFGAGAAALEAGAWAAYFARRTETAREYADDGAAAALDPQTRASCLTVGARVRHAAGHLDEAEPMFVEAIGAASGAARLAPQVWLGVLRSQQSRPADALELMRPATRVELGGERTTELLHALLYTGHSQALSGRPLEALATYRRYDLELDRRQVPRYRGRGANFTGWIRRSLGQWEHADDENLRALDELGTEDFPETVVAAHADLASSHLLNGRLDAARSSIASAEAVLGPNLTFGWRLALRTQLLRARLHLVEGELELARQTAADVVRDAAAIGVPRYVDEAQLHVLHAESLLSSRDHALASSAPLIERLPSTVGIDAWWLLAGVATALGVDVLQHEVDRLVATLQRSSGDEGHALPVALARLRRRAG